MLKVQEIRELIKLLDGSSIDEFEYKTEDATLTMKKNTGVQAVPVSEQVVQTAPVQTNQAAPEQAQPANNTAENKPAEANAPADQPDENLHKIVSPMVGTFYARPNPESDNYVKKGSSVQEDSVVCIVEAMKLFNEIEAEVKGEIVDVLVSDGELVEYGQPLFTVKPE